MRIRILFESPCGNRFDSCISDAIIAIRRALLSMKLAKLYQKKKIKVSTGRQFLLIGEAFVAMGTVKWFNPTKGYGFIQPDDGGKDVFVHISAVEKAGLSTLGEGARVSYELFAGRGGKSSAEKLRLG